MNRGALLPASTLIRARTLALAPAPALDLALALALAPTPTLTLTLTRARLPATLPPHGPSLRAARRAPNIALVAHRLLLTLTLTLNLALTLALTLVLTLALTLTRWHIGFSWAVRAAAIAGHVWLCFWSFAEFLGPVGTSWDFVEAAIVNGNGATLWYVP